MADAGCRQCWLLRGSALALDLEACNEKSLVLLRACLRPGTLPHRHTSPPLNTPVPSRTLTRCANQQKRHTSTAWSTGAPPRRAPRNIGVYRTPNTKRWLDGSRTDRKHLAPRLQKELYRKRAAIRKTAAPQRTNGRITPTENEQLAASNRRQSIYLPDW